MLPQSVKYIISEDVYKSQYITTVFSMVILLIFLLCFVVMFSEMKSLFSDYEFMKLSILEDEKESH